MMGFWSALAFLSRLPVPEEAHLAPIDQPRVAGWFGAAGLALGLLTALVAEAAMMLLGPWVGAGVAVAAGVLMTGALHEDALADVCDAFFAKRDREKMLDIMKDSRIGSFGAIGLICLLGLKYAGLAGVGGITTSGHALYAVILTKHSIPLSPLSVNVIPALLVMPVMGRWSQVFAAALSPYARSKSGTGSFIVEDTTARHMLCASLLPLCLLWFFYALMGFVIFAIIGIFALMWIWYIKKKIGGITGDTLGATNEMVELMFLLSLIAILKM